MLAQPGERAGVSTQHAAQVVANVGVMMRTTRLDQGRP
jgi:hypothetical protein